MLPSVSLGDLSQLSIKMKFGISHLSSRPTCFIFRQQASVFTFKLRIHKPSKQGGCMESKFTTFAWNSLQFCSGRNRQFLEGHFNIKFASVGKNYGSLGNGDDSQDDPFWLSLANEAAWALRSLLVFLMEQPSQLKHIEWPSFKSTLKTAALTLVLVALLIVALSSLDSALCYSLALLLRRAP